MTATTFVRPGSPECSLQAAQGGRHDTTSSPVVPSPRTPRPVVGRTEGDLSGPAKRPTYAHSGLSLAALARINDNVRRSLACRPGTTDADRKEQ